MFDLPTDEERKGAMTQAITNISVEVLKVHPRNAEFFDDISGEEYDRFKKSIQDDGLLSPLIVAPDMTVISGHQRLKACKELGFKSVPVIIKDDLEDEDEKLKKLIAANFGRLKNDQVKQGKLIKEYERLCGITHGGSRRNNFALKQEDIARGLNTDVRTVQNLKRLLDMIPEFQELVSAGNINPTTGYKLIARLSEEEQMQLLNLLPVARKFTQAQVQQYIDQMKGLTEDNAKYKQEAVEATRAAKASEDGQEYLRMKEKVERAEQEMADHRAQYEAWKKEQQEEREKRKTSAAERKAEIDRIKADAAAQVKNAQDQLEKANKLLADAKKGEKKPSEKEIVEVVPDDYEDALAENERLKAENQSMSIQLQSLTSGNSTNISKQIQRIHSDGSTQEEWVSIFSDRLVDKIGGYLSIARGFADQLNLCASFSSTIKELIHKEIQEIDAIHEKLDKAIMGGEEKWKIA